MRKLLILPLLFFLLMGCGDKHHYPTVLLMADSLCDVNPKAAIDTLDSLEKLMAQASEPDQMYYRLLHIKAADKAYIPHTSDSLIRTVLDYYEHGGDPKLLPIAYYYGGRVNMDLGDAPQAMEWYQKALHDSNIDSYLQGIIHHQLARLYWNQHIIEKAILHYRFSLQNHLILKDSTNVLFDLISLAGVYEDWKRPDSSAYLYHAAYQLADKMDDETMKTDISTQLVRFYCVQNQLDSAHLYLSQLISHPDSEDITANYSAAAMYYTKKGKTDSAIYYNRKKLYLKNIYSKEEASRELTTIYYGSFLTDSAQKYLGHYLQYLDSTRQRQAAEEVATSEMLFNQRLNEKRIHQLQMDNIKKNYTIAVVVVAFLLISVIAALVRRRYLEKMEKMRKKHELLDILIKKKELENEIKREKRIEEIKMLENRINSLSENNAQMKRELLEQKRKIEVLFLASENADIKHKKVKELATKAGIFDTIRRRVSRNEILSGNDWENIRELITSLSPAFYITLMEIVKMNDLETKISMLIKLDVKIGEIGILVATSKQNVSAIRRRLYEKAFNIKKAVPTDWDQLLFAI